MTGFQLVFSSFFLFLQFAKSHQTSSGHERPAEPLFLMTKAAEEQKLLKSTQLMDSGKLIEIHWTMVQFLKAMKKILF